MMDYKKVLKATLQNGGYSEVKGFQFMVGTPIKEEVIPMSEFTEQSIKSYVDTVKFPENGGLGTWVNENSGKIYLDVSVGYHDYKQAIAQAKKWEQLAIYDTVNNKTINIEND